MLRPNLAAAQPGQRGGWTRRRDTQDYFIFSREFNFRQIQDVVIARVKVDNYLLSMMFKHGGYLIDATYRGECGGGG